MRAETKEKLRSEIARLATSTDPRVRQFIKLMEERYPFLFFAPSEEATPQQFFGGRGERQA